MSRFSLRATAAAAAVAMSFAGVSVATAAPASDVDKAAAETTTAAPQHNLKDVAQHRALEVFHQIILGEPLPTMEKMDAQMAEELAEKYDLEADKLAAVWEKTDKAALTLNDQLVAVEGFIAKVTGKDQEEIHAAVLEALMNVSEKNPTLATLMEKYHSHLGEEAETDEAETDEAEKAEEAKTPQKGHKAHHMKKAEEATKTEKAGESEKSEKSEKAGDAVKARVAELKDKVDSLLQDLTGDK